MSARRHLILLLDGSGVTAAKPRGLQNYSNIYRLNLAFRNHNSDGEAQIAFYIAGIGSSITSRRLKAEALGLGLLRDVEQAYMNICSNYNNAERGPDCIYVFGFSRGAVVARLIAGVISEFGLLDERDAEYFPFIWESFLAKQYQRRAGNLRDGPDLPQAASATAFANKFWRSVTGRRSLDKALSNSELPNKVAARCHMNAAIEFLGVFDSVLGLYRGDYDYEITSALLGRQLLPKRVKRALHILALHETRVQFKPILWHGLEEDESDGNLQDDEKPDRKEILEQIWMPGVHSDIGGGYPEQELADVSLLTMLERVKENTCLQLNEEFYKNLKEKVRTLEEDDQRRVTIHDERGRGIWIEDPLKSGVRIPSPNSGHNQYMHSFCKTLHLRKVVWKSCDEPVPYEAVRYPLKDVVVGCFKPPPAR